MIPIAPDYGETTTMAEQSSTNLTLLLRLRDRSDVVSWEEFHQRYGQLLYRYARSRGAADADAEDIVQEVTMYLFKAIGNFEYDARKGRFRSYLRSAVIHAMGRRANKASRQPVGLDPLNFDFLAGQQEAEQDERWEREWQLHRLRWALSEVAPHFERKTLQAFEMHVLADKSVDETAETLGLSKASIYQARSRILKAVKERLAGVDPDQDV